MTQEGGQNVMDTKVVQPFCGSLPVLCASVSRSRSVVFVGDAIDLVPRT